MKEEYYLYEIEVYKHRASGIPNEWVKEKRYYKGEVVLPDCKGQRNAIFIGKILMGNEDWIKTKEVYENDSRGEYIPLDENTVYLK